MKLNITRKCKEELYSKDEVESALNEFLIPMDEKFRKRSKEKQRILLNNPYYPGSYKYISKSLKNRNSDSEWSYDIFTIYIPELLVSIPYSIVIYWIYLALMKLKSLAFVFFNVLLWFQMPMLRFFLALYRIKEIMLYFPLFTTVIVIGIILKQLQLFGVPESEIILYLRDLDIRVTWMALLLCGYFLLLILSKYTISHEAALKRIQKRIKCNRNIPIHLNSILLSIVSKSNGDILHLYHGTHSSTLHVISIMMMKILMVVIIIVEIIMNVMKRERKLKRLKEKKYMQFKIY